MNIQWDGIEWIRVQANGLSFEVATAGTGNRFVLCLHGFPEHAYSWRHQVPYLAQLGYRVWAPNLRGYGGTDSPQEIEAYALDTLVHDVAALIDAAGMQEAILIAHDWGGILAWMLAMKRPELVTRLIVCNLPHPACFLRELSSPSQFLRSWYVLFFQIPWLPETLYRIGGAYGIAQVFRRTSSNPALLEEAIPVYRRNALRPGGLTAMLNWYRGLIRGNGWRQLSNNIYPKIEIPTLLVWGSDDIALSLRTTEGTEAYVSDFTLRILSGVSHWVQQEAPELVNAVITEWLENKK